MNPVRCSCGALLGAGATADRGTPRCSACLAKADAEPREAPRPARPVAPEVPSYFRLDLDDAPVSAPSSRGRDSLISDIRGLAPPPPEQGQRFVDPKLLNLSGGLFGNTENTLLRPPDPDALLIPPPLSSRRSLPPGELSPTPPPATVEAIPSPPRARVARPSRLRWALVGGAATLLALIAFVAARSGVEPTVPAASAAPSVAVAAPGSAPSAIADARHADEVAGTIPAVEPLEPGKARSNEATPPSPKSDNKPADVKPAAEPRKTVDAKPAAPPPAAPAAPAPAGADFDKAAARAALNSAASSAAGCKHPGEPGGRARVSVTFAPSGRATSARLDGGSFQGTRAGGCIAAAFRNARVPPFAGSSVTVSKEVFIP